MFNNNSVSSKKSDDMLEIPIDQPVDLLVLAVKNRGARCKVVHTNDPVTLRRANFDVPGEILTIKPSRVWQYKTTHYIAGKVESKRIDIASLGLEPLALNDNRTWDPEDEYWGEPDYPVNPYQKPVIEFGKRQSFEMEQILPGEDPDDWGSDPIIEASEHHARGEIVEAHKIMENILTTDLRCLDAHAHLGNWAANSTDDSTSFLVEQARRHYEVGVQIGELSLPDGFNDLLPWNRINNRPFLRCLHGYGLCFWRLGPTHKARRIFERMLWLNPADNQGIRFLLAEIDDGRTWSPEL